MFSKLLTGDRKAHLSKHTTHMHDKHAHKESMSEELADHTAEKAFKALKK